MTVPSQKFTISSCGVCVQVIPGGAVCCNEVGHPLPCTSPDGDRLVGVISVTPASDLYRTKDGPILKVTRAAAGETREAMARSATSLVRSQQLRPGGSPLFPKIFRVSEPGQGPLRVLMEFIEGPTLGSHLARERSKAMVIDALLVTLEYLAQVHTHHLVLADVKEENFICVLGPRGRLLGVKFVDFDVVSVSFDRSNGVERDTVRVGTPGYQAPEQKLGERIDCKADIYAVGCMAKKHLKGLVSEEQRAAMVEPLLRERPEDRPDARGAAHHLLKHADGGGLDAPKASKSSPWVTVSAVGIMSVAVLAASCGAILATTPSSGVPASPTALSSKDPDPADPDRKAPDEPIPATVAPLPVPPATSIASPPPPAPRALPPPALRPLPPRSLSSSLLDE